MTQQFKFFVHPAAITPQRLIFYSAENLHNTLPPYQVTFYKRSISFLSCTAVITPQRLICYIYFCSQSAVSVECAVLRTFGHDCYCKPGFWFLKFYFLECAHLQQLPYPSSAVIHWRLIHVVLKEINMRCSVKCDEAVVGLRCAVAEQCDFLVEIWMSIYEKSFSQI
ncbi:hypothetical protein T4B_10498 [Trichinella pseudospiralis]|uniref:Uncharacterized protein n=1 Tax=Trichinella pseudospiralis TaxID=6337 RepID=A0A0V1J6Q7_TRIPS|nr:hypothetical protein T4B_10498 [Trichinella pseudospiralis]KRZ30679.1 hypothetical protein T4C_11831 [Trichinella pseudospiralis]